MKIKDDPSTTENEDELFGSGKGGSNVSIGAIGAVLVLLIAVFSPLFLAASVVLSIAIWALLRFARLRISVLFSTALAVSLFSFLMLMGSHISIEPILLTLQSHEPIFERLRSVWSQTSWMSWAGVIVGCVFGLTLAYITRNKIHNNPQLVAIEGEKYYKFRYRRTPLQFLRREKTIKSLKNGTYTPKTTSGNPAFALGIEEEPINPPKDPADIKPDRVVSRYEDESITHTMINGQTGSGKTITMQNNIRHDMENGKTIFIIDCKNDPKFAAKISAWSHELHKNFYHFAPEMADEYRIQDNVEGPAFYDPLAHGNAATHTDMLISTREWDSNSEFYKAAAQSLLSTVFAVMQEMDTSDPRVKDIDVDRGNIYTFYEMVRNEANLMNGIMTISAKSQIRLLADELITALKSGRTDEAKNIKKAMAEYKGQMRGLMSSIGKYMVIPNDEQRKKIDIFKLSSEGNNVVLFSLNATKPTDMGVLIGSMICTDLTNMTSNRANSGQTNPVSIYVDEFQSLPPTAIKSMLEKARSANIGITIAFQSVQQVTAASGNDALINSLMDTCNNFIIHAGANESTAEMMSKIIGKQSVNEYMLQRRNQQGIFDFNFGNRRNMNMNEKQVDKYKIEPRVFQNLVIPKKANKYKSEAIVIKKSSSDVVDSQETGPVAHKVWMIPPDSVTKDDYFDPRSPIMRFDDKVPETGLHDDVYDDTVDDAPDTASDTILDSDSSYDVLYENRVPHVDHDDKASTRPTPSPSESLSALSRKVQERRQRMPQEAPAKTAETHEVDDRRPVSMRRSEKPRVSMQPVKKVSMHHHARQDTPVDSPKTKSRRNIVAPNSDID
jgi:hypothetical protein